jgi:hypothetical protein
MSPTSNATVVRALSAFIIIDRQGNTTHAICTLRFFCLLPPWCQLYFIECSEKSSHIPCIAINCITLGRTFSGKQPTRMEVGQVPEHIRELLVAVHAIRGDWRFGLAVLWAAPNSPQHTSHAHVDVEQLLKKSLSIDQH